MYEVNLQIQEEKTVIVISSGRSILIIVINTEGCMLETPRSCPILPYFVDRFAFGCYWVIGHIYNARQRLQTHNRS